MGAGQTAIYIAIRRGPMKVPTSGTSVYSVSSGNRTSFTGGSVNDLAVWKRTDSSSYANLQWGFSDRLRGISPWTTWTATSTTTSPVIYSHSADAEVTNASRAGQYPGTSGAGGGNPNAITVLMDDGSSASGVGYFFRRAPGFFDVVCDTGTGSAHSILHNLTTAPELIIRKCRTASGSQDWWVYAGPLSATDYLILNANNGTASFTGVWNDTAPTSSNFTVGTWVGVNTSGTTYVSYLFATCPGVSKVGTYTGTGTTLQINCGFTGGARFVLIKRTDSTGDWYVWDSARGIVAGNDPYLLLNSTAAEVTGTDYVDTYSAGFEISSTAPAAINANGGSFIFFAVS
jgi:hypothetical protein